MPNVSSEKAYELLYDHYKDTFNHQKGYLKRRNSLTIIILVIIGVLLYHIQSPEQAGVICNMLMKKQLGELPLELKFLSSILLFAYLWIVVLYFQINFLIEKQYLYLHELESKLSSVSNGFTIEREGKCYLEHYPWLSYVVHRIYVIFFPSALLIITLYRWRKEYDLWINSQELCNFTVDTIILGVVVLVVVLYIINRHFNDFYKFRSLFRNKRASEIIWFCIDTLLYFVFIGFGIYVILIS